MYPAYDAARSRRWPVWDSWGRSTSLERARSASHAPGSPAPVSPTLRHTSVLRPSHILTAPRLRSLRRPKAELDKPRRASSPPKRRALFCWPKQQSPTWAASGSASAPTTSLPARQSDRGNFHSGRLLKWSPTPPLWHIDAVGGVHPIIGASYAANDGRICSIKAQA